MEGAPGDPWTDICRNPEKNEGIDDPVLFDAICAHNPESGVKAKNQKLQYAILASDPMSGFFESHCSDLSG